MSVLIMGLDDWRAERCREIAEDRLLTAVRSCLGPSVQRLLLPPIDWDSDGLSSSSPNAPALGVPVCAFPRWLRCPRCARLATVDSGFFRLRLDPYRPERSAYVHDGCDGVPVHPVRFLRACRNGHLSDFPWIDYVHENRPKCRPASLSLNETGVSGEAADIYVRCAECNAQRSLADAFIRGGDDDAGADVKPRGFHVPCTGFHPHLRRRDTEPCGEEARTLLLGASNGWFPIILSLLSLPRAEDKLARLVEERWAEINDIETLEVARVLLKPTRQPAFAEYTPEAIFAAIGAKRQGDAAAAVEDSEQPDLKVPEWEIFTRGETVDQGHDFKLVPVAPPVGWEPFFTRVVLAERLREVRALVGFNRIESRGDFTDADPVLDERSSPLCRGHAKWVPASEVRGEGLFIQFDEERVAAWLAQPEMADHARSFLAGHRQWRRFRNIRPESDGFPGLRFVLLHSFAHALLRQLALECGYTAASIRERIYSREATADTAAQAGVLLYTATADSEGTLGGLVHLGRPENLGRLITGALEALRVCASDPLCAEHPPILDPRTIHAACCHACLFASETSCERGNRYLDRAVLVPTLRDGQMAYFFPPGPDGDA